MPKKSTPPDFQTDPNSTSKSALNEFENEKYTYQIGTL